MQQILDSKNSSYDHWQSLWKQPVTFSQGGDHWETGTGWPRNTTLLEKQKNGWQKQNKTHLNSSLDISCFHVAVYNFFLYSFF